MQKRPSWYTDEHDSAWDRVRDAFRRDWEQTRHDFGSKTARDLDQDVGDTVRQATGSEHGFEHHEPAFRFGHAARRRYGTQYPTWNDEVEQRLRDDYGGDWARDRGFVRHAYDYSYTASTGALPLDTRDELGRR